MAADDSSPTPRVVEECRGVLRVYSDGSVSRSPGPSFPVPVRDDGSVEWRDALFDPAHGLHLRLYKPRCRPAGAKLPVFFYFHGGGFCIGSRTWPNCQNYCLRLASALGALVVAPDYRLAPKTPSPPPSSTPPPPSPGSALAAADDDDHGSPPPAPTSPASSSPATPPEEHRPPPRRPVRLPRRPGRAEPGPRRRVRPPHALLRRSRADPVRVGVPGRRVPEPGPERPLLAPRAPGRARLDHPTVNPFGPESPSLEPVEFEPVLVVVGGKDLFEGPGADYAARLSRMGKPVELVEFEGQQHGFFTIDPWSEPSDELMRRVKRFVDECCARSS
uniref:Alpha/beta hydrolase fold-3 domain-containing protein n=1 Tax=Ananas comosus var. bracteatus TaxID=296719 RepID=A0A6V7NM40_ANACO|nr:unnamed protein product [Ananas comosus var. bracteatus]